MNCINSAPPYQWLRSSEDIAALAALFTKADWIAFDSESNSMHVYQERVCLMQCRVQDRYLLIDPLALPQERASLGPLADALEDPQIPVYVHGGEYDVVCMQRDYQIHLRGIFDTQQAASLLGWQKTGYGAVVEHCCGLRLPKGHSDYNWGQRPLDQEALEYALDDVRFLPDLVADLSAAIVEQDLSEELAIANAAVEGVQARAKGFDPASFWRLRGISEVPNTRLALLVALHQWRDQLAEQLDRPPGRVLANDLLVALARIAPSNFGMLRKMRLGSRLLREQGEAIIQVIQQALANPPAIPDPPARREHNPQERQREKALKNWRKQEAERRGVTTQAVLPARALDHLKRCGSDNLEAVPQLGAKRIGLYGDILRQLAR